MALYFEGDTHNVSATSYLHAAKGKFKFTPDTGADEIIVTGEELLRLNEGIVSGTATRRLYLDVNSTIEPLAGSFMASDTAESHATTASNAIVDSGETLTINGDDTQSVFYATLIIGKIRVATYTEEDSSQADGAQTGINKFYVLRPQGWRGDNQFTFVREEDISDAGSNSSNAVIANQEITASNLDRFTVADSGSDRSDFQNVFTSIEGDEILCFSDSDSAFDPATASEGDQVGLDPDSAIAYQVIDYSQTTGIATISRIGGEEKKVTNYKEITLENNNCTYPVRLEPTSLTDASAKMEIEALGKSSVTYHLFNT